MERYVEWDHRIERVKLFDWAGIKLARPWCEHGNCRAGAEYWASFCVPGLRAGYVATVKGALCDIHAQEWAAQKGVEMPRVVVVRVA